jgi:hypothetical protein
VWYNGDEYKGEWVNDYMDGVGEYHYADMYILKGTFSSNNIKGDCKLVDPEGNEKSVKVTDGRITIDLEIQNGRVSGNGILINANLDKYHGYFENNVMTNGKLQSKQYKGEMKSDKKHGVGAHYYFDHRIIFDGFWNEDSRIEGYCMYDPNDCDWVIYDGEWTSNTWKEGFLLYSNGVRYDGEFSNTDRHGKGKMRLANGDIYVGQQYYNNLSGQGTLYNYKWEKSEGQFENGLLKNGTIHNSEY